MDELGRRDGNYSRKFPPRNGDDEFRVCLTIGIRPFKWIDHTVLHPDGNIRRSMSWRFPYTWRRVTNNVTVASVCELAIMNWSVAGNRRPPWQCVQSSPRCIKRYNRVCIAETVNFGLTMQYLVRVGGRCKALCRKGQKERLSRRVNFRPFPWLHK